ncbi:3-epi-6-deoxocathasterone 23-monooxygenase CYP90D1 [Cryptomeria japonica]|uniref:3-epi-6-deoxocathasterone 23-monooxygenase CYP90D1 n=1 Tax=Cryptomeria japonica TaxID=3369 RepID=UPI0025ABA9BB|nr:3-epi-6-deoxocathasterone 23-monooxygenase CYP90D1 [Cryptomeria japonica]
MAVLQILGAIVAGILGFLWLAMLWAGQLHRPKRAPPGSFGLPVIGETLQFIRDSRSKNPQVYADKRKAKYGQPVFTTHHMGYPTVMSIDPEVNKFILQNEGKYFLSNYPKSVRSLFGEGSIASTYGDLHKRIHNAVLSFINTTKLKQIIMADVEYVIKTNMSNWEGRTVYVEDECKMMAFNIISKYLLGLMPGEETKFLMKEYKKFIEGIISLPIRIPGNYYNRSMTSKENCIKVMEKIVEERRRIPHSENKDILDALMNDTDQNGGKIPDHIIYNNIMNLFGAGDETGPMAMMCAVKFVYECPKALDQLREEHFAIRRRKESGEPLTWNDYANCMTFTHQVINETLRLVNPAAGVNRKVVKDVEFKGYFFPKGWLAFPYFRNVHLDETVYPDPLTFNPWRWEKKIPSIYFTPFGGGPRICAGQELGKLEIAILLHYLVTQFTWVHHEDEIINFPAVSFVNKLPITVKRLQ